MLQTLIRKIYDGVIRWLIDHILASGAGILDEEYEMVWFPDDDSFLFADNKQRLWEWKAQIKTRLAILRLTIHPEAHPRPVNEGIPFLGFITFPQRRRLKRRKGVCFLRKLRRQFAQYGMGELSLDDLNVDVGGWVNHVRYGNTIGLRRATLSPKPASAKSNPKT